MERIIKTYTLFLLPDVQRETFENAVREAFSQVPQKLTRAGSVEGLGLYKSQDQPQRYLLEITWIGYTVVEGVFEEVLTVVMNDLTSMAIAIDTHTWEMVSTHDWRQ